MEIVVSTLLLLMASALAAQDPIRYYRENGEDASGPETAAYYRVVEKIENGEELRTYYWLPSKVKKEEGRYVDGKRHGLFKTYYRNGVPNTEIIYGTAHTQYVQFWSPNGKPLLRLGTGFVPEAAMPGWSISYMEIEDSLLTCATSIRTEKGDTICYGDNIRPQYPGGDQQLYKKLRQAVVYPEADQEMGITGTVMLDFVVNKSGVMEEITVARGISFGCDAAAIAALKTMEPFMPATYKGKPVKVKMRLPIIFNLEDDAEENEKGRKKKKKDGTR
jgi:TonB family protein